MHRSLNSALVAVLLCLAPLLCLVSTAHAVTSEDEIRDLHQLVTDWQTAEARARLDPLLVEEPGSPMLRFVEARLLFFEGRYDQSLQVIENLLGEFGENVPRQLVELRDEVKATHEKLKDFDEHATPDGRFLIRYKGNDRLLLPYVLEVLQRTDAVLAEDFGYRPEGRVVVEIYPEITYLAAVSPLTEEDIETSGTIALCKYNRLMFTSPRALVRGYGWRDTVAHEFVHYYVTKLSANTVPIWLHEGIAKFQESRWRTEPGELLAPPQEDLLARSLKDDKLVTFQQMHPSMAKLPSQEAAGLAFAQVHTVIHFLHGKKGYEGLRDLLGRLREGDAMDAALGRVYGYDLDGLWTVWKKELKGQGLREWPGLVRTSMKFKRPGDPQSDDEAEADYGTIEEKRVKDFTHLAELLRARNRHKAALVEYQKAIALGGDGNPVIQNGAAAAMLAQDRHADVPEALSRVLQYYPEFVNTHLHLGEAYVKLQDVEKAIAAFEQAIGINPFHPRPHQALAALYKAQGRAEDAAREQTALEILNR